MLVICPVCKGTGKIKATTKQQMRTEAIKTLYKDGFGIRQIQRLLGFKSPQSVSYVLQKYKLK